MKKALLIIDMQKGSFTPKTPRFDTQGVVARINGLAELFRKHKLPVIFIQHHGNGSGDFEKGTGDWQLLDDLVVAPSDLQVDKRANDVFYQSELQSILTALGTRELYITGCATDFCVESTVQSALTKEYHLVVVADGHTTGDRPHLSAPKVIEHYNWVWQNMLPTNGSITVSSFEHIRESFSK